MAKRIKIEYFSNSNGSGFISVEHPDKFETISDVGAYEMNAVVSKISEALSARYSESSALSLTGKQFNKLKELLKK